MSDPLSGGAAKVAKEMMTEVQSAMREQAAQVQDKQVQGPQFGEVLDSQRLGQVGGMQNNTVDVLRAARNAQGVPQVPAVGQNLDSRPVASGIQRMMNDVMNGQNKLEAIIDLSLSGRNFSSQELLALQAGVYRFTQELELTSKVVEKATATVKQTMNTQV